MKNSRFTIKLDGAGLKEIEDVTTRLVVESSLGLPSMFHIILAAQEKPQTAEIVAVGPGGIVDGKEVKMEVKVGNKVILSKYSGTEVKVDGENYVIVRQNDILAIVE